MIDCVTIGDTIALNVALPLSCEVRASNNLTSSHTIQLANGKYHEICIISVGSYDPLNTKLYKNLSSIRNQSVCKVYVWIKPVNSEANKTVQKIITNHNDLGVDIVPGPDNILPIDYNELAGSILNITGN